MTNKTRAVVADICEFKKAKEEFRRTHRYMEIQVKELTKELKTALSEVKRKEEEIIKLKTYSEEINKELIETNQALSTLARNINREKELSENKVYNTIVADVMPVIAELQNNKTCEKCSADLEVMKIHLNGLISDRIEYHEIITSLTEHEMRVVVLIKKGLTNKKIANMLFISEHTVKTHRRNIRKKLNISDPNINLCSYLGRNEEIARV